MCEDNPKYELVHHFVLQKEDDVTCNLIDVCFKHRLDLAIEAMRDKINESPNDYYRVVERHCFERKVMDKYEILEQEKIKKANLRYQSKKYEVQIEGERESTCSGLPDIEIYVYLVKEFEDREEAISFARKYKNEHRECRYASVIEKYDDTEEITTDDGIVYHDGEVIYTIGSSLYC